MVKITTIWSKLATVSTLLTKYGHNVCPLDKNNLLLNYLSKINLKDILSLSLIRKILVGTLLRTLG